MANTMVLSQDEALEFVAFLVTAARCLMDEAVDYGPIVCSKLLSVYAVAWDLGATIALHSPCSKVWLWTFLRN